MDLVADFCKLILCYGGVQVDENEALLGLVVFLLSAKQCLYGEIKLVDGVGFDVKGSVWCFGGISEYPEVLDVFECEVFRYHLCCL